MYIVFPQITEVSRKIYFTSYPNIKKFEKNEPFNSKEGPFLSKEELTELINACPLCQPALTLAFDS